MDRYEYGIALKGDTTDPHRTGMTKDEADHWMREWVQMSGRSNMFEIIRRPVGEWEIVRRFETI